MTTTAARTASKSAKRHVGRPSVIEDGRVDALILALKSSGPATLTAADIAVLKTSKRAVDTALAENFIVVKTTKRHSTVDENGVEVFGRGRPMNVYGLAKRGNDRARRLAQRAAKLAEATAPQTALAVA